MLLAGGWRHETRRRFHPAPGGWPAKNMAFQPLENCFGLGRPGNWSIDSTTPCKFASVPADVDWVT